MNVKASSREIKFEGSATYKIVVQGYVSTDWSDRLGGLVITHSGSEEDYSGTTSLVGPIRDQAQLNGVLDTLYNMHTTILHVDRVEN
jgi:hypothetical protein